MLRDRNVRGGSVSETMAMGWDQKKPARRDWERKWGFLSVLHVVAKTDGAQVVTVAKEDICGHSSEAIVDGLARSSQILDNDSKDKRLKDLLGPSAGFSEDDELVRLS